MVDLIKNDNAEDRELALQAIRVVVDQIDPGVIDQLFPEWIDKYVSLLDEVENNQSNVQVRSILSDYQESTL